MKGLVANIQRYSLNDGDGIRTIVFLKGCPLRCAWCANPEMQEPEQQVLLNRNKCISCGQCVRACPQQKYGIQGSGECQKCFHCVEICPTGASELVGRMMTVEEVLEEVEKDRIFYDNSHGGMTLSGGESLAQPFFAEALLRAAKREGLHCAIETSGFAKPETAGKILELCDQILYDVKQMDTTIHRLYTGQGNEIILDNLRDAATKDAERIIVRVPLIEGVNCTEENLDALCRMCLKLGIRRIDLLPYHEMALHKYRELGRKYTFPGKTPDRDRLRWARDRIMGTGLQCRLYG